MNLSLSEKSGREFSIDIKYSTYYNKGITVIGDSICRI